MVSHFFPEVRKERVDVFLEVARNSPDGLLVGCCRQAPMLLYEPEMVAAFKAETGIDPQAIDAPNHDDYLRWIKWRADHFTQVLRDLRQGLKPTEQEQGRRIPVAVRIPSSGFLYNLAQGLDVEQWVAEGLADQIQWDPLETWGGRWSHDVRPDVELGRKHGVTIIGGIGATGPVSAMATRLRRAMGLADAGVDGIEIHETELLAQTSDWRWTLSFFGNPYRALSFLADSNLEACYPVSRSVAACGHDNHSNWHDGQYSIYDESKLGL